MKSNKVVMWTNEKKSKTLKKAKENKNVIKIATDKNHTKVRQKSVSIKSMALVEVIGRNMKTNFSLQPIKQAYS